MDSLDFNLHALILSDLARNVGETSISFVPDSPDIEIITSKAETLDAPMNSIHDGAQTLKVFMPASRVNCNIAFGKLASILPPVYIESVTTILMDMLRDVFYLDFDACLSWTDWSLPDQLVFSTTTALLRLASANVAHRSNIINAVAAFLKRIVEDLNSTRVIYVITQVAPAFHGFYRAVTSTPFPWTYSEWHSLSSNISMTIASNIPGKFDNLMFDALQEPFDEDCAENKYIRSFMSKYVSMGRPLTGYFIICCVVELQWTILAQTLSEHIGDIPTNSASLDVAVASNRAWFHLMDHPINSLSNAGVVEDQSLQKTILDALQLFSELQEQIEEMGDESSVDTYAWESMAECLKLGAVCSLAIGTLPTALLARLKLLLSEKSPIIENLIQEASLQSLSVLVLNFPGVSLELTTHLRKYVTAPLAIFESEFLANERVPVPLTAAARCLASCIKLSPGDDTLLSNIYSLLNFISATGQDPGLSIRHTFSKADLGDQETIDSFRSELLAWNEDQRQLVSISTISVVTKLALEFDVEEVTKLTVSMLLQRLRTAEPTVEAAIAYNLVSLALVAPAGIVGDIFRAFSSLNTSANKDDPSYSSNMIVASQTKLARDIQARPELCEPYFIELLNLFSEKGIAIQTLAGTPRSSQIEGLLDQLAALLLPIEAILEHADFDPSIKATPEITRLMRNMWFLCILFGFNVPKDQLYSVSEWQRSALTRIATKTPCIVEEGIQDYVIGELECNSVIRQNFVTSTADKLRALLIRYIPDWTSEVKHMPASHVLFLLSVHSIETMRAARGLPSSLARNFCNSGLNRHNPLGSCLGALAEKVMRDSVNEMSRQVESHAMPHTMSVELQSLLVFSCHRVERIRHYASRYLNHLITSFPSLMCDPPLVNAILEVLSMLQKASAGKFVDEFNPTWEFHSERTSVALLLPDSYHIRDELLTDLLANSNVWFDMALARAPLEFQATLQKYLSSHGSITLLNEVELGPSIALRFATAVPPGERKIAPMFQHSSYGADRTKIVVDGLASAEHSIGEATAMKQLTTGGEDTTNDHLLTSNNLRSKFSQVIQSVRDKSSNLKIRDMKTLLYRCAAAILRMELRDATLLRYLIVLPFEIFSPAAMAVGIQTWTWLIGEKPELEFAIVTEIDACWTATIKQRKGIFSHALNYDDPFNIPVAYNPTDRLVIDREQTTANRTLTPHSMVLQMLLSRFQAARYDRPGLVFVVMRLILRSAKAFGTMSTHSLAREPRFSFLLFGFEGLKSSKMDSYCENKLRQSLYSTALSWFSTMPQWIYGGSKTQIDADIKILTEFLQLLRYDGIRGSHVISSHGNLNTGDLKDHRKMNKILRDLIILLTEHELFRSSVWSEPIHDIRRASDTSDKNLNVGTWSDLMESAWQTDPAIAFYMLERFTNPHLRIFLSKKVRKCPQMVLKIPHALRLWLSATVNEPRSPELALCLLWDPVPPIMAIELFNPPHNNTTHLVVQYSQRSLAQHSIDVTFFYIPQVVQALREDRLGYVEKIIIQTTRISQLFCHQIIWNMRANCYKGDQAVIEDSMKPSLERITNLIVTSLDGEARAFYEREFAFFSEITSISGKLKPYIKRTKQEKKVKIDEEMAKITVDVGVYLPSNPDGVVVDIDKHSGRPLQSHAKAPFMATFKVRKEIFSLNTDPDSILGEAGEGKLTAIQQDIWQSAIFKVGDDCRQDVLALQVIAMFKNIFAGVGLPLYLFPYRVTATDPGCGVIDVVPNATSRDEMGRAKVNDLNGFFLSKYGGQDTVAFQQARMNFIQSMAAYSLACYILQIKDRHNGNIMIDGDGHIIHVDFGFLFDIGPGGIKFEPNSFKLTHEMVLLMGGRDSQGYAIFQKLTVKGFLAIRPYMEQIVATVRLMLGTDFPSFKGESTIKRLRERFVPGLNERLAAEWMVSVIKDAHENVRSTVYDEFQRIQNGIPYA